MEGRRRERGEEGGRVGRQGGGWLASSVEPVLSPDLESTGEICRS